MELVHGFPFFFPSTSRRNSFCEGALLAESERLGDVWASGKAVFALLESTGGAEFAKFSCSCNRRRG